MFNQDPTAANTGKRSLGWIQPLLIICAISILGLGYSLYSTRNAFQERIATLETNLDATTHEMTQFRASSEGQATELASNLELVTKRMGVTEGDLQKSRQQLAQRMKQQQELVEQKLATELATKASSTDVDTLRQEATSKLAEVQGVQKDANAKLGTVSNDVTVVKQDLAATRRDLSRDLSDVKTTLSDGIARNASELAQLRKKGEREYLDLAIQKNQKPPFQRVGDVQIALTKTDPKKQKYSVVIQVDDNRLEKKDRTSNEPIQFLVGRNQLRYELVVNTIDKDQVRGYLSLPKDKILSAEGPTNRP
jgi:chromosome segregation ATPase